jgi:glycosyltransferase involved in cell wall biosynthesis
MIVKNEADKIEKILTDIENHVDEIIIADTGSDDNTIELCRKYTSKIYEIPWKDDFSYARNFCIPCTTTDYIIWLDADDRVSEENARRIGMLRNTLPEDRRMAGFFNIVNEIDATKKYRSQQLRLFPRERRKDGFWDIYWEGRIHEQISRTIAQCGIETFSMPITINHLGYTSPKMVKEKQTRNLKLLMLQYNEKKNPDVVFHIAASLFILGRQEESYEYIKEVREMKLQPWYNSSAFLAADCLGSMKRYDELTPIMEETVSKDPENPLLHYATARVYMEAGDMSNVLKHIALAKKYPVPANSFFPVPTNINERIDELYGEAMKWQTPKPLSITV